MYKIIILSLCLLCVGTVFAQKQVNSDSKKVIYIMGIQNSLDKEIFDLLQQHQYQVVFQNCVVIPKEYGRMKRTNLVAKNELMRFLSEEQLEQISFISQFTDSNIISETKEQEQEEEN